MHYFIVLVKCGENVLHTNLMSSDESIKSGWVEFSHYMQLLGLPPDFSVTLEAYSLVVALLVRPSCTRIDLENLPRLGWWQSVEEEGHAESQEAHGHSERSKSLSVVLERASTKDVFLASVSSPGHLVAVDPSFQKLGSLVLNRSHVNRQKFLLSDVTGPLEGPVELRMRAFAEKSTTLSQRGFLSVYQVVENLGSWNRFWCVLRGPLLSCWKWPEDEDKKVISIRRHRHLRRFAGAMPATAAGQMRHPVHSRPSIGGVLPACHRSAAESLYARRWQRGRTVGTDGQCPF